MADQQQLSLAQLWQLYQQQQQLGMIQPNGRYMGRQWMPSDLDQMVSPFGGRLPPDRNTLDADGVASDRSNQLRQQKL